MSGLAGQSSGTRPALSIATVSGGNLQITTTRPGQLQSTTALKGTNTIWHDEGIISSMLTIAPSPSAPGKFFRVVAQ
jgi:hypothetical protein